jgi:soluble lytic murein transglycosylase
MTRRATVAVGVMAFGFLWATTVPRAQRGQPAAAAEADLWLASRTSGSPLAALGRAAADLFEGRADQARLVFSQSTNDPLLGGYALLYVGRAQLALGRPDEAAATARQVAQSARTTQLTEAAHWLTADAAELRGKWVDAVRALDDIAKGKSLRLAQAHLRSGRASLQLGDKPAALRSFTRVYYEFALTAEAEEAGAEIARLNPGAAPSARNAELELGRATQLYGARRYAEARKAFEGLRRIPGGADRSLPELRVAQCDFYLKRYPIARDALVAYLSRSKERLPEAQLFYLNTLRELGRRDEYLAGIKAFVDANAQDPAAELALNDLGTHYILTSEDARAAAVFLDMYDRYPLGAFADRAAWKAGWWAYKTRDYATTARLFESAAVSFRRADYRPTWLYWAARAREQMGDRAAALAQFRRVIADYRNSYYGRQATRETDRLTAETRPPAGRGVTPATATTTSTPTAFVGGQTPPNAAVVRALLSAGLYDDAVAELRRAQRELATSPLLEATIAYALNRKGDLRPAINGMRRAYPQFMAEGGEALPRDILTVIFPLDYWDLIQKYASARGLDPYLMSALIAQESTFQADVRSAANAWGLMQIIPGTGARYARRLGILPFGTSRLTDPDVNIRIGMAYFSDLLARFHDPALALAAYNAGENRVTRWLAERPGVDRDQFIDDIPFPETQNYVKRIIGTAEDYRILYRDRPPTARLSSGP